jgi:excisionase family DNA binding protein
MTMAPKTDTTTTTTTTGLLSTLEAARRLGVSDQTVRRWIRAGRIAALRVGERTFGVPPREVERVRALPRPRPGPKSADELVEAKRAALRTGRFPSTCAACGRAFSASRPNARYCSPRCAARAYARAHRAKQRQAGVV